MIDMFSRQVRSIRSRNILNSFQCSKNLELVLLKVTVGRSCQAKQILYVLNYKFVQVKD